jgi:hypothetical protein
MISYACWVHFDFSSKHCVRWYLLLLMSTSKCLHVSPVWRLPLSHGILRRTVLPSNCTHFWEVTQSSSGMVLQIHRKVPQSENARSSRFRFCWPPITRDGKISPNAMGCWPSCCVRNVRTVGQIPDERQPAISTRRVTACTGISFAYVHHTVQEQLYQERRNCASLGLGSAAFTTNMCGQMKILMRLEHIQQRQTSIKQSAGI